MSRIFSMVFKHPITTVLGIAVGMGQYIQAVGTVFPTDANGWGHLVLGMLLVGLGVAAADVKE